MSLLKSEQIDCCAHILVGECLSIDYRFKCIEGGQENLFLASGPAKFQFLQEECITSLDTGSLWADVLPCQPSPCFDAKPSCCQPHNWYSNCNRCTWPAVHHVDLLRWWQLCFWVWNFLCTQERVNSRAGMAKTATNEFGRVYLSVTVCLWLAELTWFSLSSSNTSNSPQKVQPKNAKPQLQFPSPHITNGNTQNSKP